MASLSRCMARRDRFDRIFLCPHPDQISPPVYLTYSLAFCVLQNPPISIGVELEGPAPRGESDGCRPRFHRLISAEPSMLRKIFLDLKLERVLIRIHCKGDDGGPQQRLAHRANTSSH